MSKFDFTSTVNKLQASFKKDQRRAEQFGVGNSLASISSDPKDYVVLPDWFKKYFGVMGLRFGHMVEIAGEPDSGKTSLSILAMKAAQEQGYAVIYAETEGKTSSDDLEAAGIDSKGILTIHSKITEEVYDGVNRALDLIKDEFPNEKILLVIDSYGNTTSMRDSEIDLTQKTQQVGGAAKTNRMGLGSIAAKQLNQDIAVLVVNYTYDNIGGVGKTHAGGKGLGFYTMLRIQSSRKAWYEKTLSGVKVRAGADVLWKTYKNHYSKSIKDEEGNQRLLPKQLVLRISGEGFQEIE